MREASRVGGNEFSGGRESAYFLHCFRPIQWPLCSLGYDAHTTPRSEALHQSIFGFLNCEILGHDEVGGSSLVDSGPRARVRRYRRYFDLILGQCLQVKDNCHQAKTSRGGVGLQYFGLEMCRKCVRSSRWWYTFRADDDRRRTANGVPALGKDTYLEYTFSSVDTVGNPQGLSAPPLSTPFTHSSPLNRVPC